jgi:hypothetical protein
MKTGETSGARVGMGFFSYDPLLAPIPLLTSPLKGEELSHLGFTLHSSPSNTHMLQHHPRHMLQPRRALFLFHEIARQEARQRVPTR